MFELSTSQLRYTTLMILEIYIQRSINMVLIRVYILIKSLRLNDILKGVCGHQEDKRFKTNSKVFQHEVIEKMRNCQEIFDGRLPVCCFGSVRNPLVLINS